MNYFVLGKLQCNFLQKNILICRGQFSTDDHDSVECPGDLEDSSFVSRSIKLRCNNYNCVGERTGRSWAALTPARLIAVYWRKPITAALRRSATVRAFRHVIGN